MEFESRESYMIKYGSLRGAYLHKGDELIEICTNKDDDIDMGAFLQRLLILAGQYEGQREDLQSIISHSFSGTKRLVRLVHELFE